MKDEGNVIEIDHQELAHSDHVLQGTFHFEFSRLLGLSSILLLSSIVFYCLEGVIIRNIDQEEGGEKDNDEENKDDDDFVANDIEDGDDTCSQNAPPASFASVRIISAATFSCAIPLLSPVFHQRFLCRKVLVNGFLSMLTTSFTFLSVLKPNYLKTRMSGHISRVRLWITNHFVPRQQEMVSMVRF